MPWYLVEASHGPGHQGHTSELVYTPREQDEAGEKELWDQAFSYGADFDWPIGKVYKLKGLTENERADKIVTLQERIKHAQEMLEILNATPVIRHRILDRKSNLCSCGEHIYKCTRCGKSRCWHFPSDNGWCPECQKCGDGKHEWDYKQPPVVCTKCGVEHPFEKYWAKQRKFDNSGGTKK